MRKHVRPSVLLFAAVALLVSLGYVVFPHADVHTEGGAESFAPAPEFFLTRLDGSTLSSADLKGKVVVLDFWATWCAPCWTEIPKYSELYDEYGERGFEVLGVTLQSGSADHVREWLDETHVLGSMELDPTYPILMGNAEIEAEYGPIYGFPYTFLIDPDWRLRMTWRGAVPSKAEDIREMLEELLPPPAATSGIIGEAIAPPTADDLNAPSTP